MTPDFGGSRVAWVAWVAVAVADRVRQSLVGTVTLVIYSRLEQEDALLPQAVGPPSRRSGTRSDDDVVGFL